MTSRNSDSEWPVYKVHRGLTGVHLVSHLSLMHGLWCKSVHDTEELNQECHESDHEHRFGTYFIPHAHVKPPEIEEWSWE